MDAYQRTFWEMTSPRTGIPFKQWKLREGERLYNQGAQRLANTELLAHITRNQQVAEALMKHLGTLEAIADASIDELRQVIGVGEATAEMIISAFELGRRAIKRSDTFYTINSPKDVRFAHRRLALRWAYGTTSPTSGE